MIDERVAFIIPCKNEEKAVSQVINRIKQCFPDARIYVGDNASTDNTREIAKSLGVQVVVQPRSGKGNVIRKMIKEIDADVFIMADGDNTYEIEKAEEMVQMISEEGYDLVISERVNTENISMERKWHVFGNLIFNFLFKMLFKKSHVDVLSGLRAFNKSFAEQFPARSTGFEIEVEMSAFAEVNNFAVGFSKSQYVPRMVGDKSKLRTWTDGLKILRAVLRIHRKERPIVQFSFLSIIFLLIAIIPIGRAVLPYLETGKVQYFPSLIVGVGVFIFASLFLAIGVILENLKS